MKLPQVLLAVLAVFACSLVVGGVVVMVEGPPTRPRMTAQGPEVPTSAPEPRGTALSVLRQWDARRAAAWAAGDTGVLRALYTPDSVAGRRDVSMLRRWVDRGLRVRGMQMQVLGSTVVEETADRLVVRITDRLTGAVAVGRGSRVVLPSDRESTRTISLRRIAGEWRVAAVSEGPWRAPR